jgi:hypothetical protein
VFKKELLAINKNSAVIKKFVDDSFNQLNDKIKLK